MYWSALLVAIISNIIANLSFKKAVAATPIEEGAEGFIKLAADPWMWAGFLSAGLLLGCYLYALKGIDLSIAYPVVTGFAMVGIALSGALFFGESLSLAKIFAMTLIIAGVFILKFSS